MKKSYATYGKKYVRRRKGNGKGKKKEKKGEIV